MTHQFRQHAAEVPVPDYRPVERFWPYVDLPEQPTDEELAALNPELSEALFGTPKLPFSVTLEFPRVRRSRIRAGARDGACVGRVSASWAPARAVAIARDSIHARPRLRDLFDHRRTIRLDRRADRRKPVPYARELWLPLMWFLIR